MCKKKQFRYCPSEIDECMRNVVGIIDESINTISVVACCCGHGKYNMTILIRDDFTGKVYDLVSGVTVPRKRNFYKRDKRGYYYIPETQSNGKVTK